MPRDFDDAQGQRWTALQVGSFVSEDDQNDEEQPFLGVTLADVEFRSATGATVHGALASGELHHASDDDLREALEKALSATVARS